jgi:hypothetical protein
VAASAAREEGSSLRTRYAESTTTQREPEPNSGVAGSSIRPSVPPQEKKAAQARKTAASLIFHRAERHSYKVTWLREL